MSALIDDRRASLQAGRWPMSLVPKWLPKSGIASPTHDTLTHESWLNQAEIEIGIFSRQCLGSRRIPNLKTLRQQSKAWHRRMNRNGIKIAWKFDFKTARRKLVTNGNLSSGHAIPTKSQVFCPDEQTCCCFDDPGHPGTD